MAVSRRDFLLRVGQAGGYSAAFLTMQSMGLMPAAAAQIQTPLTVAPGEPLPAPEILVASVKAHQEEIAAIKLHFIWDFKITVDEFDGAGNLKKSTSRMYETMLVHNQRYSKVVAKDGVPLTPEEVAKQTEIVEKRIAEREAHPPKATDPDAVNPLSPEGILKFCTVSNERWETRSGRQVVAMDFTSSPDVKDANRMMKSIGGTMWIDPEAEQMVAMHIEVLKDIPIGGGLVANFEKGSTLEFEQTRVHDKVWLPSRREQHVSARLLLKGMHQNETVEYSNYKEFKTESKIVGGAEPVSEP
jgi:hypothetical protein